jgi:hypothetical protein
MKDRRAPHHDTIASSGRQCGNALAIYGMDAMIADTTVIFRLAQRTFGALVVVLGFSVLAACQTQGDIVQQENTLAAAGFSVRIMLNRLPPSRFVVRVHDFVTHYVYADPGCGCLYVGSQQSFNQYLYNQQLDIAHEQQMAIQDFYDPAWDWAAWGPWGPLGPVYGPGVGGW